MVQVWLPTPGGSFFCDRCCLEYEKEGICECGGEIEFISMHSNRYLGVWMKSRKAFDAKKERDGKEKIQAKIII